MIEVRRMSFCAYKKLSQHVPFVGKNPNFSDYRKCQR